MPPELYIAKSGAKHAPALPLDAVTRTFGIYGQRGTGKTNTAVVLVEEMVAKRAHVVVLDPVGAWWGITHAGEKRGLPGIVLGGDHGDVPLEETAGVLVAGLVVGRHWPVVVIDLKRLRKGARRRFMADFLEELYETNSAALHVVFEEADQALPQNPRGMDPTLGRVLGAAEDIVKLGRGRGLGTSLVSQRFATVNANVREQVETLILHRLTGPLDRKAAKGWIEANGDAAVTQRILDALPGFGLGDALMYSPGWLRVMEQIRVKHRRTFDSSATPEVGAAPVNPTERAPVDLDELRERMAETVERAKANDPRELRATIEALRAELREERESPAVKLVDVPVLPRERFDQLDALAAEMRRREEGLLAAVDEKVELFERVYSELFEAITKLRTDLAPVLEENVYPPLTRGPVVAPQPRVTERRGEFVAPPSSNGGEPRGDGSVSGPEQRVLDSLAWLATAGIAPAKRVQAAMVAGYHERTKGFLNALGSLRSAGRIDYPQAGLVALTAEGEALARAPQSPPSLGELHRMIFEQVGPAKSRVLDQVIRCYPGSVARPDLAAALGYHERTKGFLNALGSLRTLGLIDYPGAGLVEATDILFPRQLDGVSVR